MGSLLVAAHFGDQQAERIEPPFLADALDEFDCHLPSVEVPLEIEQVDFQQSWTVIDRGSDPETRD